MCGRFISTTPAAQLADYFGAEQPPADLGHFVSYNVAPTQGILVVIESDGIRTIDVFHWGLVPSWAKDPKIGTRLINARAETIAEKPSFRRAFARRRCIIPADGFYEWASPDDGSGSKQPIFIRRVDGAPFAFAGLWESWTDPHTTDGNGEPMRLLSCTIITGEPNDKVAEIHHRMPVMLPPSSWDQWLDRANHDTEALQSMLVPAPSRLIEFHPVSRAVNNVRNNSAELIEPAKLGG